LITTTLLTAAGALAADAPATQPIAVAAAGPTTAPAEAIALLDRVNAQYGKLKSARFDGKVTGKFDIAGQSKNDDVTFSSTFRAPNQFRHDAVNDVLLGSTGEKVFAFERTHNQYVTADAPKDRSPLSDWPRIVPGILQQQNPSLLLALTKNSTDDLRDLGDAVKVLPDTTLAGVAYNTIQFDLPPDHEIVTMLFDPKTSLMRQAKFDLRQPLEKRGATDVKAAEVTVDYTTVSPDAEVDATQFAWTPPPGATQAATTSGAGQIGEDNPVVAAIVGKPAADFTLNTLDDKPVKLSSLKGSVVLLDFWATWCGPCVMSLPQLEAMYKDLGPKGLKAFAVNQEEDKDTVKAFANEKKLTIPMLLDLKGEASKPYGVEEGIPVTVIVGKDGIVKRAFAGTNDEIEEKIRQTIEKELGS
jgi:thiol-disulfide isomerase/thioredoxin/outer membrane lipoprotein-sorting protein